MSERPTGGPTTGPPDRSPGPALGGPLGRLGPARRVLPYADAMRVLGACCVVMLHVAAPQPGDPVRGGLAFHLVGEACRWCVPAFFMLSGALLLDPSRRESAGAFYRRRFWRIGVPVAFWTAAYWLFRAWAFGERFTPGELLRDLAKGEPMWHLWFVYALAGLYLFTPLLRGLLLPAPRRTQWAFALAALAAGSASYLCTVWLGVRRMPQVTDTWAHYLGFFLLGAVLRDVALTRRLGARASAAFVLGVVTLALAQYTLARSGHDRWHGFVAGNLNPLAVATAVAAYLALAAALSRPVFTRRPFPALGAASFGAYLVHLMVRELLVLAGAPPDAGRTLGQALAMWCVIAPVSFACAWLLLRVPVARAVVGGGPAR